MTTDFYSMFSKLFITILLTGLIGLERELRPGRAVAGLRTHILVGLSACMLVLTSHFIFDIYKTANSQLDPSRIVHGILTGIGFLCGGTIIRNRTDVQGLTTAASLWTATGIGIAVGVGYYEVAGVTAVLVFIVLRTLKKLEERILRNFNKTEGK